MTKHPIKRVKSSPVISKIYIECKTFVQLSAEEVYRIAKLRQDVFMMEQQSIYMDLDNLDQNSWHFLVLTRTDAGPILAAYARLRYQSEKDLFKIERVVCNKNYRGQGIGNLLIDNVLKKSHMLSPKPQLYLSSQLSAVALYEKFGFTKTGEIYADGGIDHIDMMLVLKTQNSPA